MAKCLELVAEEKSSLYEDLLNLDDKCLVENSEEFDCPICLEICLPNQGVVLLDCLHNFCKTCLIDYVRNQNKCEVICPYVDKDYSCESTIQNGELKELLPLADFLKILDRSLEKVEINVKSMFQCKTPHCLGFYDVAEISSFQCDLCRALNCVQCAAIHPHLSCGQYKQAIANDVYMLDQDFEELMKRDQAMKCPKCSIYITRVSGCDGMVCTKCDTEICWATKGPRWGPKGKGDTSGGCGCSRFRKCHPNCKNCH